jgi:nucleotide-binding universal stress UspA family protein
MRILICSDGSVQAENAIRVGSLIAAPLSAETTLLGITEKPGEEDAIFESLKRGLQLLKEHEVPGELVIKSGDAIEEIVRRTQETNYDLVVIGATRKGTRGPFLMSAKAYKIIKAVEPPVLVVIGDRKALKRVLICSGGEKYIDKAVDFAGKIAGAARASVTLFHVLNQPVALDDVNRIEEDVNILLHSNSELGENLRREKELLERLGVESEVRIRHGLVISEVFKEVRRADYDLVVTGSSPIGGTLRTYIMGNITREIVNRAECPVLVVRGEDEPAGIGRSLKGFFSDITQVFGSSREEN